MSSYLLIIIRVKLHVNRQGCCSLCEHKQRSERQQLSYAQHRHPVCPTGNSLCRLLGFWVWVTVYPQPSPGDTEHLDLDFSRCSQKEQQCQKKTLNLAFCQSSSEIFKIITVWSTHPWKLNTSSHLESHCCNKSHDIGNKKVVSCLRQSTGLRTL